MRYYVFVKSSFKHTREECESKRASVVLYPCMFCVALSMDLFVLCVACLTVFVNWLVKQFVMCLGVVTILLLNVMDVFSVCGGALLDRPCMVFQRVRVLCL